MLFARKKIHHSSVRSFRRSDWEYYLEGCSPAVCVARLIIPGHLKKSIKDTQEQRGPDCGISSLAHR